MREGLTDAQRALRDAVAIEHKYALSAEEAPLRWAIEDVCPMHFVPGPGQLATAALLNYRLASMLDFHRESKRARFARARDTAPQRPRAL